MATPKEFVEKMYRNDPFSQWLGIKILQVEEGYCKVQMSVREEMTNGFDIAHGGISYSLADSALAFASGSYGKIAPGLNNQINYLKKVEAGDTLTAIGKVENLTRKTGVFNVEIFNQSDEKVAVMRGTVYRMDQDL